jgi:aminopeptidase N
MEKASRKGLESFFQQWLYRAKIPILKVSWEANKQGKSINLVIEQTQAGTPFEFTLEVGLVDEKGLQTIEKVRISQKTQKITLPVAAKTQKIALDPLVNLLFDEIVKN